MNPDRDVISIHLPEWFSDFLAAQGNTFPSHEDRMRLAIKLAQKNVEQNTGGPFGAVICSTQTGKLVAAGINIVTTAHCSMAHAEMVALALAQQSRGSHILTECELASSTEPCAMCLGAIPWSGVQSLLCGARGADAEAIGFDEGTKPRQWRAALERRGVQVTRNILRDEARAVLQSYKRRGGPVY
ncbi:MAG: nucleoside deaminase [Planctomycetes bacterium]|nr:nucleoside deaminase [Planctomycetota bacterium]